MKKHNKKQSLKALEKKLAAKIAKRKVSKSLLEQFAFPRIDIRESSNDQWRANETRCEIPA